MSEFKRRRFLKRLYKESSKKICEREVFLWSKDREDIFLSLIEQDDLEVNKIGLNLIETYCRMKHKALKKERLCKKITMN